MIELNLGSLFKGFNISLVFLSTNLLPISWFQKVRDQSVSPMLRCAAVAQAGRPPARQLGLHLHPAVALQYPCLHWCRRRFRLVLLQTTCQVLFFFQFTYFNSLQQWRRPANRLLLYALHDVRAYFSVHLGRAHLCQGRLFKVEFCSSYLFC